MLAVVFAATMMDGLDSNIVNVALPTIGESMGVDTATVSWVTVVYSMVLAGLLVMFARIAADTGVRRIMAGGLLVFTVGSAMCGVSHLAGDVQFGFLIASRAVQAVGASMMGAAGPMCCTEHLPPAKLAFGLAVVTIGSSVGFALGPAVGGLVMEFLPWYWIFLINIPIGLAMMPVMLRAVPRSSEKGGKASLDGVGVALLFAAVALITFGIEELSQEDMRVPAVAAAVVGVVLLAVFARWEKGREAPLLKVGMFGKADFTAIFACLMLINFAYMGVIYLIPFYSEKVLGNGALVTGGLMLISAAITAIAGMPIARWSDRRGRRPFCIGAALLAGSGFAFMGVLASDMSNALFVVPQILMGLGWAFVGGPMASRLVEHAGSERDMASSLTNEAYYIGGTMGTAAAALAFTAFSGTGGVDIELLTSAQLLDGYAPCMFMTAAVCAAIAILSAVVRDQSADGSI